MAITPLYRTDPLSPSYRTGTADTMSRPRTQPRPATLPGTNIPPNPYKGTGQNAYWNGQQGRWVPFTDPNTLPTVATSQQKLDTGPSWQDSALKIVTPFAALAGGDAAQEMGETLGNRLSNVPFLRDVLASDAAGNVAYGVKDLAATNKLGQFTEDIGQGDYGNAAWQLAQWLGENVANVSVGGPGVKAGWAGVKAGGPAAGASALGQAVKAMSPTQKVWSALNTLGGGLGILDVITGQSRKKAESKATADRAERMAATQPGATQVARTPQATGVPEQSTAGFTRPNTMSPYYQSSPYGSTPVTRYTDDAGRVMVWNPRSRIYEIAGLAGEPEAGKPNIPDLSAAEQQYYENMLSNIDAETQAILAELGVAEESAKRTAEQETTASRQQVAGGSQDIASALAFMGLDTSPGVLGVGQEAQAQAGVRREQAIQQALADQIAAFSSQRAEAERRQRAERARIISERELAHQAKIEDEARRRQELLFMQGGY